MVTDHTRSSHSKGVAYAKGLPEDINPLTKHLLSSYAEHTYSWLKYTEVNKVNERSYMMDMNMRIELPYLPIDLSNENFRIVFGFDS